jgi:predicted metal-dependent hydrolase
VIEWLRRAVPAPRPAAGEVTAQVRVGDRLLPLELRRLSHARRMTLRLAPDGQAVRISLPHGVPAHEALAFARARSAWLAAQAARVPAVQPPGPGSTIAYRGKPVTLVWNAKAARRPQQVDSRIVLGGPEQGLGPRLARWLEAEARRDLAQDLADYCARARRPVPKLALSRARRRWGSCSADGTIRINWRLIMAPDAVRRSVVAHEVAHLVHFDHSPAFHACLADLFEGSVDEANAWLKRHGPGLYQPFG